MRPEDPEARLRKALSHPLRARIFAAFDGGVRSPREISEELGAPLSNVSYHVRQLRSSGLIKLVRTTPRRGALEHHYRRVKPQ